MSLLTSASSLSRSTSLLLPDAFSPAAAAAACRPVLPRLSTRPAATAARAGGVRHKPSRQLVVKAQQGQPGRSVLAAVKTSCSKFLGRYDPVTTATGSLLVTGYCVAVHGQPVSEALSIAASATILGMVMQEVLFRDDGDGKPGSHA